MVSKKAYPNARLFTVKGDVKVGAEVGLHDILTWAKQSDAEKFCGGGEPALSKQVVIAERGGSFEGGMTMLIGESDTWPVMLGDDRFVAPMKEGQVLSVLWSEWVKISGTRRWEVQPKVIGHIMVTPEGARYVAHKLSVES